MTWRRDVTCERHTAATAILAALVENDDMHLVRPDSFASDGTRVVGQTSIERKARFARYAADLLAAELARVPTA